MENIKDSIELVREAIKLIDKAKAHGWDAADEIQGRRFVLMDGVVGITFALSCCEVLKYWLMIEKKVYPALIPIATGDGMALFYYTITINTPYNGLMGHVSDEAKYESYPECFLACINDAFDLLTKIHEAKNTGILL